MSVFNFTWDSELSKEIYNFTGKDGKIPYKTSEKKQGQTVIT